MRVKKFMTKRIVTIGFDVSLGEIYEMFQNAPFSHVLVLDDEEKLAGIISDRDVLRTISPYLNTASESNRDLITLQRKAHQIMTRNPCTITLQDTHASAAKLMLNHRISSLPVVDESGELKGIVTSRDLIELLAKAVPKGDAGGN